MSKTEKRVEAVAALIADRRKYESWLAALEAKRAETPDHVFFRVRSDYERRLSEVLERLRTQATALNERADALTARLAVLIEEEQASRDKRSEAELRAAVGEVTPEAWDALVKNTTETVTRIAAERASIQTELGEIRELLGGGKQPSTAAPAAGKTGRASGPSEAPDLPPDELAFLRSLITPEVPSKTQPGASSNLLAPPTKPSAPSVHSGLVVKESEPLLDPPGTGGDAPPLSSNVPESESVVLRSDSVRDGKTLRCGECGALNVPTEWYCERCGSELAPN